MVQSGRLDQCFPHPDHPMVSEEDVGLWGYISVAATRRPLEFALAAAVAITLARPGDGKVIDEALVWNRIYEQSPDEFADALKVSGLFNDIHQAAQLLEEKMPFDKRR